MNNKDQDGVLCISLESVDWLLLKKQKLALLELADSDNEDVNGIVHFLDDIQDKAAEILGEKAVFGELRNDEICQRCGERGEDRRTLHMACFYAMEELDVPFEEEVVYHGPKGDFEGEIVEKPPMLELGDGRSINLGSPKVRIDEPITAHSQYTLRVCKNCRAEWMNAIEQWFKAGKQTKSTGTGVFIRKNGTNVELNDAEIEKWKAEHGGAEPCRVLN